jgi:anthranilate phosphoribosyltransferase
MTFDVTQYIKEIGRGKEGARALTREQAKELFKAILEGRVCDVALGAVLMAYRVKGETPQELAGMLDALAETVPAPIAPKSHNRPIVMASMNGARHTPNLTLLLGSLLAREGVPTLIHATSFDSKRVTTIAIVQAMNLPICSSVSEVSAQFERSKLAVIASNDLCAPLDRLLCQRWVMGVRNSAHTVAKMFNPLAKDANAIQLVSVTHPEYMTAMREFYLDKDLAANDCVLMRGTEGEPVRSSKRPQAVELLRPGHAAEVILEALEGSVEQMPELPAAMDAQTTAAWTQEVLDGHIAVPRSIQEQVNALVVLSSQRAM